MKIISDKRNGGGLIEVVVGAAIIVLVVLSLISAFALYLREGLANPYRVKAALLAEEGVEALKFLRDGGWTSNVAGLTVGSTYYLDFSSGTWHSTAVPSMVDGKFQRTFILYSVMRDGSDNIVLTGGTNDLGTRKAQVSVAWRSANGTTTKQISTYIFDLYGN